MKVYCLIVKNFYFKLFSLVKQFYFKPFSLTWVRNLVLFNPVCYHSWPEWTWEQWQGRGAPYSLKPKLHSNLTIRLFRDISRTLIGRGSYSSAENQSVYSTAPAWLGGSIWHIDGTLKCTLTADPNEPGSNGNEYVLQELKISGLEPHHLIF